MKRLTINMGTVCSQNATRVSREGMAVERTVWPIGDWLRVWRPWVVRGALSVTLTSCSLAWGEPNEAQNPVASSEELPENPVEARIVGGQGESEFSATRSVEIVVEKEEGKVAENLLVVTSEEGVTGTFKPMSSRFWLGIQTSTLNDTIKSQLKLEHGLIVLEVIPETPAAKAGLLAHDILLTVDEEKIQTIEDLLRLLDRKEGNPLHLQILRAGATLALEVKPDPRPQEGAANNPPRDVLTINNGIRLNVDSGQLQIQAQQPGGEQPLRMIVMDPWVSVTHPAGPLPPDVTVTIARTGAEKPQVTVKRGEKSWTTAMDNLESLPVDVRTFVGPAPQIVVTGRAEHTYVPMPHVVPLPPGFAPPGPHGPVVPTSPPAVTQRAVPPAGEATAAELQDLRAQINDLRSALDELRTVIKQNQDALQAK